MIGPVQAHSKTPGRMAGGFFWVRDGLRELYYIAATKSGRMPAAWS